VPVPRGGIRPSGAQRLLRIRGGTEGAFGVVENVPVEARSLLIQNPLTATLYLLFDNRVGRSPDDAAGPDYDLAIPPQANAVYPFPAGSKYVTCLVHYPGGAAVSAENTRDVVARWTPVYYDPSITQNGLVTAAGALTASFVTNGVGVPNDGSAFTAGVLNPNGTTTPLEVALKGYTGAAFDALRLAKIFKTLSAVTITSETTVWTPAGGKRFRLMGYVLTQTTATGNITVRDNTAGATILIIPANTLGAAFAAPPMGNGILSAAANNVLTFQGASTEAVSGYLFGTEE
jgi:hypothetical protein